MAIHEIRAANGESASDEMQHVRTLLLGEKNSLVKDTIRDNAREVVTDVISEAIHDRQLKDDSLSHSLTPLVESAIEHSIETNRDNFVRCLYPIVGGLVRKSVAIFFSDFLENLNHLIEHSLTFKSLKWRFQAWRKGIPFSYYILRKTFIYRVEQVFFIHRKSGSLLKSVTPGSSPLNDIALVSAMLTAIRDFVADSFTTDTKNSLNVIKTDKFTLSIEEGPQALLVVAVSGTMPNSIRSDLQQTLQELHQQYRKELMAFDGDNTPFSSSENPLRNCLLFETNPDNIKQKKKPVFAITALCVIGLLVLFWIAHIFSQNRFMNKLLLIQQEPGIHVQAVAMGNDGIPELTVFRDPSAKPVRQWLKEQGVGQHKVKILEQNFLSLEPAIITARASRIVADEPGIRFGLANDNLIITGQASRPLSISAQQRLLALATVDQLDMSALKLDTSIPPKIDPSIAEHALFKQQADELTQWQLNFDADSAIVNATTQNRLPAIAKNIELITRLSAKLNIAMGIIISGTSDKTGTERINQKLSLQRASNVRARLINSGIEAELLYATGLGEIDLPAIAHNSRKVLFSIIYLKD